MKVLLGGGTGFIGRTLHRILESKGHEVTMISRSGGPGRITWEEISNSGLPDCKAVVNLAGENIMNPFKRWNEEFLHSLRESRIGTNRILVQKIGESPAPPDVFISSSAVSFYPPSTDQQYTEDDPPTDHPDVLTQLCFDWEESAKLPPGCPTRLCTVRVGLALGRDGGVIQGSIWPFWLGLGGVLGSGKQFSPWIHVEDVAGIYAHAIECDHVTGVLNGVAPEVATNERFTRLFAGALWRPAIFPVPAFALNLVFGADRAKLMLEGQHVIPKRTLDLGYKFKFPDLQSALNDIVN